MEDNQPNDPHLERAWVGLGQQTEATPQRQFGAEAAFEQRIEYARKSKTHMWVVALMHFASDEMLASFTSPDPSDLPILDHESIAGRPMVYCVVCEEPYSDRLKMRKCKGDPKGYVSVP